MEVKPIGDKISGCLNCPLSSKSRLRSILPLPPKEEAVMKRFQFFVVRRCEAVIFCFAKLYLSCGKFIYNCRGRRPRRPEKTGVVFCFAK